MCLLLMCVRICYEDLHVRVCVKDYFLCVLLRLLCSLLDTVIGIEDMNSRYMNSRYEFKI